MIIKFTKAEVGNLLIEKLKVIYPEKEIINTSSYDGFEFEITEKKGEPTNE